MCLFFVLFISAIMLQLPSTAFVKAESGICDATNGVFGSTMSYVPPNEYLARQNSATTWLKSMMQARGNNTGDGSTITPDQTYKYDYTGPIEGTFSLANSYPTHSSTPLTVTSPTSIDDNYRGTVTGTATMPGPGAYEVRAFKLTDAEYMQPEAIPAIVQPGGSWNINLSGVPGNRGGAWNFGLFNSDTDEQVGDYWPKPTFYTNLAIELYSVSDAEYLSGTMSEVPADGSFNFSQSYVGTKLIRLRNTNTNEVLAEYYEPTGLIRSYQYLPGETGYGTNSEQRTYTYDQGLALAVAVAQNDKAWADKLIEGLALIQVPSGTSRGAFPFSAPQLGPTAADPIYRTGAQAIITYALLKYQEAYGASGNTLIESMTQDSLDYLQTQKATSGDTLGLYAGGTGRYVSTVLDSEYIIPWTSTEHNIDVWHTLKLAGKILHNQTYSDSADSLKDVILTKLWNPGLQRFNQGYEDTSDALDINSWGAIFLSAIGEYEKAEQANINVESFKSTVNGTSGYIPFIANRGYPGATPTIWYEGTYGVAFSRFLTKGLTGSSPIIDGVIDNQTAEGAWRYANVEDPVYEFGSSRSVASTTWYLLAAVHPEEMWAECEYVAPIAEPAVNPKTGLPITGQSSSNPQNTPPTTTESNTDNRRKVIIPDPVTKTIEKPNNIVKITNKKTPSTITYIIAGLLSPPFMYLVYRLVKLAARR